MKNNQKPANDLTVVIVKDSDGNEVESVGLLKEKKSFNLTQIKSYLYLALTLADWEEETIENLIHVLEILMDNIDVKAAMRHYLQNHLDK